MSIRTAPCDWPIPDGQVCEELVYHPLADELVEAATAYLWTWTGKAYGLCEVEVRPCRVDCAGSTYLGQAGIPYASTGGRRTFVPQLVGGEWRNLTCGSCGDPCSCGSTVSSVSLPGPVDSIESVTIDGEPLDASAYRVDDRTRLVRQDGGTWPACQDLAKPAGDPGTWSVLYRWGVPVPMGGRIAAGVLACEMAKALRGDDDCALPVRIQTVTREGISVAVLDAFEGLEAGRTGLWVVDSWVESIRSSPSRSTVHVPRPRRGSVTTYGGA